jgi:MFS family permease
MTYLVAGIVGLTGVMSSLLLPKGHSIRKSFEVHKSLRSVMRNQGVQLVSVVQIFSALSDIAIATYFPLLASTEMRLSASMIALLMSLYPLGMMLIRIPLPKIFEKISPARLLTVALAAFMITMVAIPLAKTLLLLAVSICFAGLAHGMIWPAASLHLSHSVKGKDLGLANAIYGGTGDVIGMAAPVALSSIIGLMGYSALYYAAFLIDLAGLLMLSAWSAQLQHRGMRQ